MNRYTFILFLLICFMSNSSFAQWSIGASTGIMSGKNIVITGYELVSTSPYIIHRNVFGDRNSVSNSVSVQLGYMFKNLHLFAGYNSGTNSINPIFIQANGGWNIMLGASNFGIMPYTGIAYRLRNLEQRDYGITGTAGFQFQKWIFSEKAPIHFIYLQAEYSYRHTSVSIGIKGLLQKNK